MLRIFVQKFRGGNSHALMGQMAFMASNLAILILLLKKLPQEQVGVWGIFLTLVAIVEGIRQGLLQNALTRLIILEPEREKSLIGAALFIHVGLISLASGGFYWSSHSLGEFWNMPDLAPLLRQSWKALFTMGTLQGLAALAFAKGNTRHYLIQNLSYLVLVIGGVLIAMYLGEIHLEILLNIQFIATLPILLGAIKWAKFSFTFPSRKDFGDLIQDGKYIAGTNLFSLLFQKADLLMIGYFLDPGAVGLFHFASRLLQYVELPLTALGQNIYPRLAASYRTGAVSQLKSEYSRSVLFLFALIIPGLVGVLLMHRPLILLMSTKEFLQAVPVLILLSLGTLAKPWGRISGMTLDAIGQPRINFFLLLFSLAVNVLFNWILIQKMGLMGAAFATSLSVILTVVVGQWKVAKYLEFKPISVVWADLKNYLKPVLNSY